MHAVATRIGIGIYDEAWFRHRLELFEAITVPSMARQTSQGFTWLLVIDENMPPVARERLNRAIAAVSSAQTIEVEFKSNLKTAVASWAKNRAAESGARYVLTSRLDDDDALSVDCFERLHSEASDFLARSTAAKAAFSFGMGTMWIPAERRGYTRYHDSHSLGLSVMEPVGSCRGIYSWPHQEIKQRMAPHGAYLRTIDGDKLWWLYATHLLADSDTGDLKRIDKVRNHKSGYRVNDTMLESFGLNPVVIDKLAELPVPTVSKPVNRLAIRALDTESEIKRLRKLLKSAEAPQRDALRRQLKELEARRVDAGSGLVGAAVSQSPSPSVSASSGQSRQGLLSRLARKKSKR